MAANSVLSGAALEEKSRRMTGNDRSRTQADKSAAARTRKIIVDADNEFRPGRRSTMTSNYESKRPQRRLGWIWVWAVDVVPPFLVGEVAGSLSIDEDREQIRRFAESIFEWLERTERSGGATIHRLP
jgi:hypothetical protein